MSPEEFQRLKEAEKEHLRKLKQLKDAARGAQRQQGLTRAFEQITGAGGDDALNTREEMLERLSMDAARDEARMELALEAAAEREAAARRQAEMEKLEEETRQGRARDLVRQLKMEMGGAPEPPAERRSDPAPTTPAAGRPDTPAPPTPGPETRPDKTIGRM